MLRSVLVLFITVIFTFPTFSQGTLTYTLKVIDRNRNPVTNLKVSAIETSQFKTVEGVTDSEGKVLLELKDGKTWSMNIGELQDCYRRHSYKNVSVEANELYVYEPEDYYRKQKQDPNRVNDGYEVKIQNINPKQEFEQGFCMVKVHIYSPEPIMLKGYEVKLVNSRDSIIYKATTNTKGEAYYIVPNKTSYDIDIDDYKNKGYIDIGDEYAIKTRKYEFVPTLIEEVNNNDTITQKFLRNTAASSSRALVQINVIKRGQAAPKENVYLTDVNGTVTYKTKTSSQGTAKFLVPIDHAYLVSFDFQQNKDVVNLKYANERTKYIVDLHYYPDPQLEHPEMFIPDPNQLFVKPFNSFLQKQFEKPEDKPFYLKVFNLKEINASSREALFGITLAGSATYGDEVRFPLNVALVIDKSGSMYSENRSEALKATLWKIGNDLQPNDIITIVLFDTEANAVVLRSKNPQEDIETIIKFYEPGGGTSILRGLEVGIAQVLKGVDPDRSNRIILLTDGYGSQPPENLLNVVSEAFDKGVEFSTIGIGQHCNQALLKLISKEGNGIFTSVEEADDLSKAVLKEFKQSFHYMAKDLSVEMYYDSVLVFKQLYGYPETKDKDGVVTWAVGKIPQNLNEIFFVKFKLLEANAEIEEKPLILKVSYFDVVTEKHVSYADTVRLEWTEETETEFLIDQHERTLYAIAILNQTLKVMAECYRANDLNGAKEHIKAGQDQINKIFPDARPKDVIKLFKQLDEYYKVFTKMQKNQKLKEN